jgi:hypothetical protein
MSIIRSTITLALLFGLAVSLSADPDRPRRSAAGVTQSKYTKGRAVFRETSFDFGKVPQGSRVSKVFYLVNEGIDTLELIEIKPG